ncbi:endonuclease/exonuclease/phosphatase family protein [uncultured Phycicoccus sp.]|uniref:endonuclease/exonuclease/phosphatase family protein n=1 Tax=uncultured Phycicoccus sp. TaxID=661422 RepID=UPI002617F108|nr:endonuclease/exonuclease/phosphatase family protein [uncultured Phycicoccus sp.]
MARTTPRWTASRTAGVAVAVMMALGAMLTTAPAQAAPKDRDTVVVMTQNLYLGSSLTPALAASTPEGFVAAVAQIYATVQYTNFPARAEAIADEIQARGPDVIGLQEVSRWTTGGINPPPGYDFLAILQSALTARGLSYSVAAVVDNASIGPAPLALASQGCVQPGPVITCSVTLDDRDVILVNDDTPGLTWSNARSGRYADQQVFDSPVGPVAFDRGWASIDAKLGNKPFRFVNTHLETEDFPLIQEAQAAEFLAGPAKGGTVIAVGDFNSAADGSTTTSYAQLTAPGRFRDAWDDATLGSGFTCCQSSNTPPLAPGALNNPVSTLRSRIDLVLGRGAARADSATAVVVGNTPFRGVPPFWPSDHAGVVAEFRL